MEFSLPVEQMLKFSLSHLIWINIIVFVPLFECNFISLSLVLVSLEQNLDWYGSAKFK